MARERPAPDWRRLGAVVGVGIALAVAGQQVFEGRLPGGEGLGALMLVVGIGVLAHVLGWRWPVEYVLTDTHLRVRRGLLARRLAPNDLVRLVCELDAESEYLRYGFRATSGAGGLIIVNPQLGDLRWMIFTPSKEFLAALLWQMGREEGALDALPEGPPLLTSRLWGDEDEE